MANISCPVGYGLNMTGFWPLKNHTEGPQRFANGGGVLWETRENKGSYMLCYIT